MSRVDAVDAAAAIRVVVNADDLGLSERTNDGIFLAHERGIVTSASVMVRPAAVEDALQRARAYPQLGLGLHVDLGEWAYLAGQWQTVYECADLDDLSSITAEVERQVARFCQLAGRPPTHLDSHQHVHREEPARTAVVECGRRLGVPVRHATANITYCGDFYAQTPKGLSYPEFISAAALAKILRGLGPGTYEVACHPGLDDALPTMYCQERQLEVTALVDPEVRRAVDERSIQLITFAQVAP